MGKKILVLLESPGKVSKVRSIFQSFKDGNTYTVHASMGHISRIADEGIYKAGIDLTTFDEKYEILPEKKEIVKKLKDAVKDSDEVYLASDGDREGECISYHWINFLKIPKTKYKRIIFKEITEKGVKDGLKNAKSQIDEDEVNAGRARAELDKLVGYRLSPLSISKVGGRSAGRVQSAALRIICDREEEIRNFKSEVYYEIFLPFKKDKRLFRAQYKGTESKSEVKIKSKATAEKIVKECTPGNYSVKTITPKERMSNPKDAFTTSTLQQAASTVLGYNPKRTMQIAQKLYEGGFITYMRTDSVRLSDDFVAECKKIIEKDYGKEYYKGFTSKKKGDQDGHEGIRPTHIEDTPQKMSVKLESEELKLYRLIYNRTLASLMSPAKIQDLEIGIFNEKYKFALVGHTVLFDGFLKVYDDSEDDEESKLPDFKIGEKIKDEELDLVKKETQPPNRFSEAGIVKTLESSGIGRPSTFAPTIETLKDRKYIIVDKKTIFPTDLGIALSKMLVEYFPTIINTTYTAEMESMLDLISSGKSKRTEELKKFWDEFNPLVLKAQREINKDKPKAEEIGRACPDCGKALVKRVSRAGQEFISCSGYPKCKHTESIDGTVTKKVEKTNFKCPKCSKGLLVKRTAKASGEVFYGCSEFMKGCKFTMSQAEFQEKSAPGYLDASTDKE